VRIACCQLTPDVEDSVRSAARAPRGARTAIAEGAQIVILPELAHCGYVFGSAQEARAAAQAATESCWRLAQEAAAATRW